MPYICSLAAAASGYEFVTRSVLFVGLKSQEGRGAEPETELQNECVFCIWGGDFGGASGFRSFANGFTYDAKNNTCARSLESRNVQGELAMLHVMSFVFAPSSSAYLCAVLDLKMRLRELSGVRPTLLSP